MIATGGGGLRVWMIGTVPTKTKLAAHIEACAVLASATGRGMNRGSKAKHTAAYSQSNQSCFHPILLFNDRLSWRPLSFLAPPYQRTNLSARPPCAVAVIQRSAIPTGSNTLSKNLYILVWKIRIGVIANQGLILTVLISRRECPN